MGSWKAPELKANPSPAALKAQGHTSLSSRISGARVGVGVNIYSHSIYSAVKYVFCGCQTQTQAVYVPNSPNHPEMCVLNPVFPSLQSGARGAAEKQQCAQQAAGSELGSLIPRLWLRGPRARSPPGSGAGAPVSLPRAPRGGRRPPVPPGPAAPPAPQSRGARSRCAAPGSPALASPPPAPRLVPGAPQRPGWTLSLHPEPGKRSGGEEEPGTPSGRSPRTGRRLSWAPLGRATMAFGKSHRDPFATSVGHLIGKGARGQTPGGGCGDRGTLPV